MPVVGSPDNLYVGIQYAIGDVINDFQGLLTKASEAKFDFVVIPLCQLKDGANEPNETPYELRPTADSDLTLDSKTWGSAVVGTLSPWIDVDAAPTEAARRKCLDALQQEYQWARHLGVYGFILPPPKSAHCPLYAGAVLRLMSGPEACTPSLMLRIPLVGSDGADGWEIWNGFRTLCDEHAKLQVALELTEDLPETERELQRWFGEPVRAVVVPLDTFTTNQQGFPVLPKRHKAFLTRCFRHRVQVILENKPEDGATQEVPAEATVRCLKSIARLYSALPCLSPQEMFEGPYHDYLQMPLQPLQDDLESQTYETFEKDPVKYIRYEEAILRYLQRRMEAGKTSFSIMVVGAGRGPLVAAARSAAATAKANVRIWAVDKNPNAVVTLKHRSRLEKWTNVEVVGCDMRFWEAPHKMDLAVSELLGSFGDNELSPECLDGAQRFLAPDGVSIPSSYTSYLTPVSTTKLWNMVRNYNDTAHFEKWYVVKFHQAFYPSEQEGNKAVFTFDHPNWELTSNDRFKSLEFVAEVDSLIHGFAGYFECTLFEDVMFSIRPETYSTGMFSWFPAFFPIKTPVMLRRGQKLTTHWWRCSNAQKVWYEWTIVEPQPQPIRNPGGRSACLSK